MALDHSNKVQEPSPNKLHKPLMLKYRSGIKRGDLGGADQESCGNGRTQLIGESKSRCARLGVRCGKLESY